MGQNLNNLPEAEQEMVSAHRRSFVIALEPKLLKRNGLLAQVLVIKAYSVAQAKRIAIKQLAVGRFTFYNRISMWKFLSVEDADAKEETGSTNRASDGSGA